MLQEYGSEVVSSVRQENARFASLYEKHRQLDKKIDEIEAGREHASDFELETMKKEKLKLKDEAYSILNHYRSAVAA